MSRTKPKTEGKNALGQALAIAKLYEKHNPPIRALADMVRNSVQMAKGAQSDASAMLGAWRMGLDGEEGFGIMTTLDTDVLKGVMRELGALHDVGVATMALVTALQAEGETIDL